MKMKVKRSVLLEKAQVYKADLDLKYALQEEKFKKDMTKWRLQLIVDLKAAVIHAEAGGEDFDTDEWQTNRMTVAIPIRMAKPVLSDVETYRVDRDLEALNACPDETLSLEPSDWLWRYLAEPERTRG